MFDIQIFTTCPQSKDVPSDYTARVIEVAKWSDSVGCDGMLIYADNSIIDPWLVAQIVLQETRRLSPLVAVQPIYMHPYTVAKMVTSLGLLYQRPVCLNMIAGGFRGDLIALGDVTAHDDRYTRLIAYSQIIQALLRGDVVTHNSAYYQTKGLNLAPALPEHLRPQFLMSGSSDAGRDAAITIGATAVEYPEQAANIIPSQHARGIRVGIIAAADRDAAWQLAWSRFPADRRGQLQHSLAIRVSDSSWQQRLGELAKDAVAETPYWLWPFKNYQTFCPYLVGDYQTVAKELARYLHLGYKTFILDIPREQTDLYNAIEVFRLAKDMQ